MTSLSDRRTFIATATGVALATTGLIGCANTQGSAARSSATTSQVRKVLWAANVRNKPLAERFEAARVGGFTHMSMFPIDYQQLLSQGQSHESIKRMVRASGIGFVACDPFTKWVPRWAMPAGYPDSYKQFVDYDADYMFRMADTLGADTINCVEPFGTKYSTEELANALGAFSERAAKNGIKTALEFMPISGIADLRAGWDVVSRVNSKNVGLTFDTWHYYRSTPNAQLLAQIPIEKIFEVQLADALAQIQGGDLITDLLQFRLAPGDGSFDIKSLLEIIRKKGSIQSIGPEVFAKAFDDMTAVDAGRKAGASLARWL
jgi:sugar phosphate isomerase/epimerase